MCSFSKHLRFAFSDFCEMGDTSNNHLNNNVSCGSETIVSCTIASASENRKFIEKSVVENAFSNNFNESGSTTKETVSFHH